MRSFEDKIERQFADNRNHNVFRLRNTNHPLNYCLATC